MTPATLSVAADSGTKVAGAVDPPLTFVANGFAAGGYRRRCAVGRIDTRGRRGGRQLRHQPGTLAANTNYTMAFTGNTFVITLAPSPAGFAIAPIRPQTNTDGDEVELQVVIVRASGPSALSVSSGNWSGRHEDGRNEDDKD